jgi:hypothetical protein
MANGDIYELTLVCQASEQIGLMRRHYETSLQAGDGPTQAQIATHFTTVFPGPIKAVMASGATYQGLIVSKVFPGQRTAATVNTTGVGAGTVVGDVLPRQVRGIITLRTAFAGPNWRGRVFLPFPCELDNAAGGLPSAGYITAASTLAGVFTTAYPAIGAGGNTATITPVLWRRVWANGVPTATRTAVPWATWVVRARFATQRRSGSYGRPNVLPL